MADVCATHPVRASTGSCARCDRKTCPVCTVEVGGATYCSIICFTEQALATKGKTLKVEPPDPLADVKLETGADPSQVLSAAQAQPSDDSSIMLRPAEEADPSETSILDLGTARKPEVEESSVTPIEGRLKDPTSILGMDAIAKGPGGSWLEKPPTPETPLPILLPGTRRSTLQATCVFHADTSAVVNCSKCGDAICTLCIADEEQGGRCSPRCRRDVRRGRRNKALLAVGGGTTVLLLLWWGFTTGRDKPAGIVGPVAVRESPAEFADRSREAERLRLEAEAREEARLRVKAREEESREKAEAEARAKVAEFARAEAYAKAALAKAEAEAKVTIEALARAEAEAKAKEEAARAAERAAKAKAKAETEAREKAEAEARAKAAAEAKAAEEARAKAAAADAKAKVEAAAKALEVEKSLVKAAALIREATPEFCEIADESPENREELRQLVDRIHSVEGKLSKAREAYAQIVSDAPDRSVLEHRIAILGELIAALKDYAERCSRAR